MILTLDDCLWCAACSTTVIVNDKYGTTPKGSSTVAGVLFVSWFATWLLLNFVGDPKDYVFYPFIDAIAGIVVFQLWRQNPLFSRGLIVVLLTMQCALHVMFWKSDDLSISNQSAYIACLNVTFAVQLLAAAFPGVKDGCARMLGHLDTTRRGRDRVRPYSAGRSGR